jgi:tetratricopeptide (TPR) repeat protein
VLFLVLGMTQKGVDNWAHAGGLVGGVFMGLALSPRAVVLGPVRAWRALALAGFFATLAGMVALGERVTGLYVEGELAQGAGDLEAAGRAYERAAGLRLGPSTGSLLLARLARARGELGRAVSILERALAADPDAEAHCTELALVLLDSGDVRRALAQMEAVKRVSPDYPDIDDHLAQMYLVAGEPANALIAAGRAREVDPDDGGTLWVAAEALERLGGGREAGTAREAYEDWLSRRMRADPTDPHAANNLAWFYFCEGRDLDRALALARSAVARSAVARSAAARSAAARSAAARSAAAEAPSDPFCVGTLGCLVLARGLAGEAQALLERAIARHRAPMDRTTDRYFAALAAHRLGRREQSRAHWLEAVRLDPYNRFRSAVEEELTRR